MNGQDRAAHPRRSDPLVRPHRDPAGEQQVKVFTPKVAEQHWAGNAHLLAAGTTRFEACGLRVEDVDFLRRTVRVRQQR